MSLEPGDPRRIDRHDADFRRLVARARAELGRGRLEAAAAWAQIGGQHAWMNHGGRFADTVLEDLLASLGARLPAVDGHRRRPAPSDPRDVLHVVTQAYGTGGSTQAVASWIEQDPGRHHRVCITHQRSASLPAKLLAPLGERPDLVRLDTRRGGLMRRAARLRGLAARADLVLLHLHPYDVVPVIAFAGAGNLPPVVFVDHTDHVFWLGTGTAGVVMHMRESGRRLAAERRGIDPLRSVVVPRPLRPRGRALARAEAKRRLGVDPRSVLLVTAADGSKYRPVDGIGFLDLVVPVLESDASAVLHAAGPSPDAAWHAAADRTGGRIRALGPLADVRTLQEAADVYLDSYPFASLTSLLEAGSLGVPGITYRGHPDDCAVLGADTPAIDGCLVTASGPREFAAALAALIANDEDRRALGARTQRAIRDTHVGAGWNAAVTDLYARAAAAERPAPAAAVERRKERLDALIDRVMTQTGFAQGVPGAAGSHLALLPLAQRTATWRTLARSGRRPRHRQAVDEWLVARLSGMHARARAKATRSPTAAGHAERRRAS